MKTNNNRKQHFQSGFSMIEVLVASTILIVIVMMLGMLFQQTSLAWRIGVKRAAGFMQVRGAIGAIQRDATAAVDARFLPKDFLDGDQKFTFPLAFYTLTGTNRALIKVTYSSSGTRTESLLQSDGTWGSAKSGNVNPSSGRLGTASSLELKRDRADYGGGALDTAGLPLFITFEASVSASGANLDIGAASAGPDRVWGTKDDIRTWVEKK
ncbi:MAG: prepilin-type N-terminal cleavage/methylation domain-containing protein [bacterium]